MEERPLTSVFFHFRFKFLAISCMAFLLYVILSSSSDFSQFAGSMQFRLMGPFFIITGLMFLVFRKFPIKCPHCARVIPTRKDWTCPNCKRKQGKERYLSEKCVHCKEVPATSSCDLCKKTFRL
ncbi:MAG TPA: hypothetical protein VJ959_07705 [Desulfotignum sp.]|nr:hypothetical protein [Desulfotignum sp.]